MATSASDRFVRNLAAGFASADWVRSALRRAAREAVGGRARWVAPLVRRLVTAHPHKPDFDAVLAWLGGDEPFNYLLSQMAIGRVDPYPVRRVFTPPALMGRPPLTAGPVELPPLPTEGAVADWLGVAPNRLRWYADTAGRNRHHPPGPLRTYRHRWVPKPGGRVRLLEAPVPGLKRLQRHLLAGLLDRIPPHPAAHGFRRRHSIVTNALPHCGKAVVVRFDLADFFPSVRAVRVVRTFRAFGYPENVARLLAGLCTTRLPYDVWQGRPNPPPNNQDYRTWLRLGSRHLPQGAPTSPALANLAAFRMDVRLTKLAAALGADYTRYADDLTFSGGDDLRRGAKRLETLVAVIANEEGFDLNHRKTRVMGRAGRQEVAGVVVNARPNVRRKEFDEVKAMLTNCVRHGPAAQNRAARTDFRAYLAGRVSHVGAVNPARGRKLWAIFDRIEWKEGRF